MYWILLLFANHQPINHEPHFQYATQKECEADKALLTDPNWKPIWTGECKQIGGTK